MVDWFGSWRCQDRRVEEAGQMVVRTLAFPTSDWLAPVEAPETGSHHWVVTCTQTHTEALQAQRQSHVQVTYAGGADTAWP
jgi:hypothetical protein